ncbi:class I SAM-dependent methyltransferase [Rhizocola hellebori]|nr:50S ribosomal protein L11 methyltransferase [Rhizocola hellebori]
MASTALDRLRLRPVPLVPQIRLLLAEDVWVLTARMEAEAGHALATPFWASAWLGGQGVARYVLDHPQTVAGLRVLDLAAGSGLVGIAAGLAGAARVTANDIDPNAITAIATNAWYNGVEVNTLLADLVDGDAGDAQVVLAGDVLYGQPLADRMLSFLRAAAANGARVIVGDPGRGYAPPDLLPLASYEIEAVADFSDSELTHTHVLEIPSPQGDHGSAAVRSSAR